MPKGQTGQLIIFAAVVIVALIGGTLALGTFGLDLGSLLGFWPVAVVGLAIGLALLMLFARRGGG
jgi:hypothetical protein